MKYHKDHRGWNKFQIILNSLDIPLLYTEGEIWRAAVGINMGKEIDGKGEGFQRPVVIIKRLNSLQFWAIPISTRTDDLHPGIHFRIINNFLDHNSVAVITQLKLMSNKRLLEKLGHINRYQFKEIVSLVGEVL